MKNRLSIYSICTFTIISFCTLNRPAVAEQLPVAVSAPERLAISNPDDNNNLVAILVGQKYGYKDNIGRMTIAPRFDDVYEFFDGVAAVQIDEKWGFIDRSGRTVVAIQFDDASSFSQGLAAVQVDEKWGFIKHRCDGDRTDV